MWHELQHIMSNTLMHRNEIKAIVLQFLYRNKYDSFTPKRIFHACEIPSSCAAIYNKVMADILLSDYVFVDDGRLKWNCYYFINQCLVFGRKCYAYYGNMKYRVSRPSHMFPMHEDIVLIKVLDSKLLEGEIVDILSRTQKHITGNLTVSNLNGVTFVLPDDRDKYIGDIYIGSDQATDPLMYCKVEVQLNKYETQRHPCGTIVRMIRNTMEDTDRNDNAVLARYGLRTSFSPQAIAEAHAIKTRISQNIYKERYVEQEKKVITIGMSDINDIAYSAHKVKEGYEICVYVPDVSAYIPEGSFLDTIAFKRCATIKSASRSYPMFPSELLPKISLVSGKKSPVVAIRMIFNVTGGVIDIEPFTAVICPDRRVDADRLNQYINKSEEDFEIDYCDVLDGLLTLKEFMSTQNVKNVSAIRQNNGFSAILEQHMCDMYDSIASMLLNKEKAPVLYVEDDSPSLFDMERFFAQSEAAGLINIDTNQKGESMESITNMLNSISSTTVETAVVEHIRSIMPCQQYSEQPRYNHLLEAQHHINVSRPISRYADLYNQRLLKRLALKTLRNDCLIEQLEKDLPNITRNLNSRMKSIHEAQKELDALANAGVMEQEKEKTFKGIAYKITPSGVFTLLENGISGLLKAENHTISDKIFEYETQNGWVPIKLGDKIDVKYDYYNMKSRRVILQPAQ